MNWLTRLVAVGVVAAPLLLGGCKQGVGERCQVQSDCDDGLLCILPAGGTPQSGGSCQPTNTIFDMASPAIDQATQSTD